MQAMKSSGIPLFSISNFQGANPINSITAEVLDLNRAAFSEKDYLERAKGVSVDDQKKTYQLYYDVISSQLNNVAQPEDRARMATMVSPILATLKFATTVVSWGETKISKDPQFMALEEQKFAEMKESLISFKKIYRQSQTQLQLWALSLSTKEQERMQKVNQKFTSGMNVNLCLKAAEIFLR